MTLNVAKWPANINLCSSLRKMQNTILIKSHQEKSADTEVCKWVFLSLKIVRARSFVYLKENLLTFANLTLFSLLQNTEKLCILKVCCLLQQMLSRQSEKESFQLLPVHFISRTWYHCISFHFFLVPGPKPATKATIRATSDFVFY